MDLLPAKIDRMVKRLTSEGTAREIFATTKAELGQTPSRRKKKLSSGEKRKRARARSRSRRK